MRVYLAVLLGIPLLLAASVGAFNVWIDPYDIYRVDATEGVNLVKPLRLEDGRRLPYSHDVLRETYRGLIAGNSRVHVGMPHGHVLEIAGDVLNTGLPNGNAVEIARMLVLAREAKALQCVFIGFDFDVFWTGRRATGDYALSALPDASRVGSWLRTAFAPLTLERAWETWRFNRAGAAFDETGPPDSYAPGAQRARFRITAQEHFNGFRSYDYDPERLALLLRAVDRLTAEGVQVIGFFSPVHAWQEEGIFAAGKGEDYLAFRRAAVAGMNAFAARPVRAPCTARSGVVDMWDFSGFRFIAQSPVPAAYAVEPAPYYRETSHFDWKVGRAMLQLMLGTPVEFEIQGDMLGERIAPEYVDAAEQALLERRTQWLTTPDAATVAVLFEEWRARDRLNPLTPRLAVEREDYDGL